ncbi:MAG: SprT-like domain-containing protein [Pseudomonadota bacterium]
MFQQTFQFTHGTEHDVADRLAALLGSKPNVVLTNNRSTMLTMQKRYGALSIRMHRCFASAPDEVLKVIASFTGRKKHAQRQMLWDYFEGWAAQNAISNELRKRKVKPVGKYFDLSQIMYDLNELHFEKKVDAAITWGRSRPPTRRRWRKSRHITLGSYCAREKTIVIHPNLDRQRVPKYVVEAVVFHEMCHHVVPKKSANGQWRSHTRQFREMERNFPMLDQAKKWEDENLDYLLKRERLST